MRSRWPCLAAVALCCLTMEAARGLSHPQHHHHESAPSSAVTTAVRGGARKDKDAKDSAEKPPHRLRRRGSKIRILILMSDTGGGHRASAKAILQALSKQFPGEFDVEIYDIWTEQGKWPLNRFVACYTYLGRRPMLWRGLWYLTAAWPMRAPIRTWHDSLHRKRFQKAMLERDPDLVVSVHPLCQHVPLSALYELPASQRPKFATVVTDLGSAHPMWFDSRADVCFVPNRRVARLARFHGVKKGAVVEHGLPLREAFEADPSERGSGALFSTNLDDAVRSSHVFHVVKHAAGNAAMKLAPFLAPPARKRRKDKLKSLFQKGSSASSSSSSSGPRVLVVGGGDGVGGMKKIVLAAADALRKRRKPATLVVVCGRNALLRKQLQEALRESDGSSPSLRVQVLGFVTDMHRKMAEADVLLTKAGPGTIAEAAALGLPVILTNFLPGQERGNCAFVTDSGFGALAKRPSRAARLLVDWLDHPDKLLAMADRAFDAAKPGSTTSIARDLAQLARDGRGLTTSGASYKLSGGGGVCPS